MVKRRRSFKSKRGFGNRSFRGRIKSRPTKRIKRYGSSRGGIRL